MTAQYLLHLYLACFVHYWYGLSKEIRLFLLTLAFSACLLLRWWKNVYMNLSLLASFVVAGSTFSQEGFEMKCYQTDRGHDVCDSFQANEPFPSKRLFASLL